MASAQAALVSQQVDYDYDPTIQLQLMRVSYLQGDVRFAPSFRDDPLTDVAGAEAAGLSALLVDRSGRAADSLRDLAELATRLAVAA